MSNHTYDVIVIGGGAAGVLLVAHLARLATTPIRIAIVDSGPGRLGTGTAYRTGDLDHLLNVRAGSMSAWFDRPDHFVTWLAARGTPTRSDGFVTRNLYGAYLTAVAYDAGSGPHARIRHIPGRAVDIARTDPSWRIRLADGSEMAASHVVLAVGIAPPAPIAVARHRPRYVADPWRPGALDGIGTGDDVLLIGTGLTAADIAVTLGRGDRRLTAISRSGLTPAAHTRHARSPMPDGTIGGDLATLRRHVHRRIAVSLAATGDWRPAIDGVRPHTQRLWQALDESDRREFLRHDRRRWESARHRMAPRVAATIGSMRTSGQLTIGAGDARTAIGATGPATWVINATGPDADVTRSPDPLLRALLRGRIARPGPLRLGLATTDPGQLTGPLGHRVPGMWTLGCTRRGDLWESSAIPEIRTQAHHLAERIDSELHATAAPVLATMEG